jgi:hypothetical protein
MQTFSARYIQAYKGLRRPWNTTHRTDVLLYTRLRSLARYWRRWFPSLRLNPSF